MAQFKDGDWKSRERTLGDIAENAFERWHRAGFVKWGLDRPPIALHSVPDHVRYTPDYLTSKFMYEVVGCGRDQLVKVKVGKYAALHYHAVGADVRLFIWDSVHERHLVATLEDFERALCNGATLGVFNDSKPKAYFSVPFSVLEEAVNNG